MTEVKDMMSESSTEIDLTIILKSRLFIYQVLHDLIGKAPDKEMLLGLAVEPSFQNLTEISKGAELIDQFIQTLGTNQGDLVIEECKEEYNRLFVGPNALPAPLWESVYLSPEHLMFDEVTLQVREAYAQFGLCSERKEHEPDDHITLELQFISTLINRMITSCWTSEPLRMMELLDGQISFLEDHLLRWAPQSFEFLYNSTSSKLYQGTALLLMEYLPCDLEIAKSIKGGFEQ